MHLYILFLHIIYVFNIHDCYHNGMNGTACKVCLRFIDCHVGFHLCKKRYGSWFGLVKVVQSCIAVQFFYCFIIAHYPFIAINLITQDAGSESD